MKRELSATSIILAGGRGLRFGRNKVWEVFGGKSLVERVAERLAPVSTQILVVSSQHQAASFKGTSLEANLVIDLLPERGPLGGIYTGLKVSRSRLNVVVASDMPFLNTGLLEYMLAVADNFDMVVPRSGDFVEPLHAIYSRDCAMSMEALLGEDRFTVRHLMASVKVRYVEPPELDRFDPKRLSFFNIDTPQDMEYARRLLAEEPGSGSPGPDGLMPAYRPEQLSCR